MKFTVNHLGVEHSARRPQDHQNYEAATWIFNRQTYARNWWQWITQYSKMQRTNLSQTFAWSRRPTVQCDTQYTSMRHTKTSKTSSTDNKSNKIKTPPPNVWKHWNFQWCRPNSASSTSLVDQSSFNQCVTQYTTCVTNTSKTSSTLDILENKDNAPSTQRQNLLWLNPGIGV